MQQGFTKLSRTAVLSLLLASPLALAQPPQGGGEPPPQTYQAPAAQAVNFSEQQVSQFADSYLDILEIQEEFTARLEQAQEPEQAQQLQQEANEEMIQAIHDNGLDVQEYTELAQAMDTDPELRQQVVELVTERQHR